MCELLSKRHKLWAIKEYFQESNHYDADNEHRNQLKKLPIKYLLVFLTTFAITVWGYYELAGWQMRLLTIGIYYTLFLVLRMFQFSLCFEMIKLELEQINRDLLQLNKIKYTIDQKAIKVRLINIRETYEKVLMVTGTINSVNSFSFLTMISMISCATICCTYWMMLYLMKNIVIINFTVGFCYMFPPIILMYMVTKPAQDCINLVSCLFLANISLFRHFFGNESSFNGINFIAQ